jgi:hypothetical protein
LDVNGLFYTDFVLVDRLLEARGFGSCLEPGLLLIGRLVARLILARRVDGCLKVDTLLMRWLDTGTILSLDMI